MALTLNVGVARKIGLPHFSSVGASCSLVLDLDPGLLDRDPDTFRARVRAAYDAADRAVRDELVRLTPTDPEAVKPAIEAHDPPPEPRSAQPRPGRRATSNQLGAIAAIARRGRLDLPAILRRDYGVARLGDLSPGQASALIDDLKDRGKDR